MSDFDKWARDLADHLARKEQAKKDEESKNQQLTDHADNGIIISDTIFDGSIYDDYDVTEDYMVYIWKDTK